MASRHRAPPVGALVAPGPFRTPINAPQGILALDFFTADLLNGTKVYVLAAIEHGTRRVRILGVTGHPVEAWAVQQAGPDLFFRRDSAFGHGVVGHPGIELAAGDEAKNGRDQAAGN